MGLNNKVIEKTILLYKSEIQKCNQRINELKLQLNDVEKEKSELQENLHQFHSLDKLENDLIITVDPDEKLEPAPINFAGRSWWEKISNYLKSYKKVMSSAELTDAILKIETERDRRSTISSISGTISIKIKEGLADRVIKHGENYVGLIEWFDENGNLRDEYNKLTRKKRG